MTEAAATAPNLSPAEIQADTLAALRRALGDDAFRTSEFRDNLRVHVETGRLLQAIGALRDLGFGVLVDLGAADYLNYPGRPGDAPRFEVHYVLLDPDTIRRIVVKVGVPAAEPIVPSITQFWTGADWMEREAFDMYGINFDGHPDLRRILMPDEFTAHPLRKDYPLRGRGERHNFPRLTRGES